MSARSFGRWRLTPRFARNLLGRFALCLAQTEEQAARFRELGAPRVDCFGNLKFSAAPLPVAEPDLATLRAALHGRSEEHTSELQSLMRISYAVFCLKNKN